MCWPGDSLACMSSFWATAQLLCRCSNGRSERGTREPAPEGGREVDGERCMVVVSIGRVVTSTYQACPAAADDDGARLARNGTHAIAMHRRTDSPSATGAAGACHYCHLPIHKAAAWPASAACLLCHMWVVPSMIHGFETILFLPSPMLRLLQQGAKIPTTSTTTTVSPTTCTHGH